MATRTAYLPTSLRYHLRSIGVLRQAARRIRRLVRLPAVVPTYARKMGFEGLRVFVVSALSRSDVLVLVPGISEPVKIRPGTSDKYCFEQVFLENSYDLPFQKEPRL